VCLRDAGKSISLMNFKSGVYLFAIGLAGTLCASATTMTGLDQLKDSDLINYGLIVAGGPSNLQTTSDTYLTGNFALGQAHDWQGGNMTINGNVDFTGLAFGSGYTVNGTITTNSTMAANAIAEAESLSASYGAVNRATNISNTNYLDVATNPGAEANNDPNQHVYVITASQLPNPGGSTPQGSLTITASASQYVTINVLPGTTANFNIGAVTLNGGITPDHVLFNIETGGQLSSGNAHGLVINALIIDNVGTVNVDNTTLNGFLFCTTAYGDCQPVSGIGISSAVNRSDMVPEPMSLVLTGSGLLLGFAFRRFRTAARPSAKTSLNHK